MNLNDLYEGREPYQQAIDKLEARRIEDLEAKMDDLARRAKEATDPKVIAALRHEFAKAKAERDSYHTVVDEHGGGGGEPSQWHAYVKAHRADEGWSDNDRTPYGVYINGKQWKEFPNDNHARAVADKLTAKLKAEGSNKVVTIAPSQKYMDSLGKDVDEASMNWAADKSTGPKFGGYLKGTDPAPTEFSKKSVGGMEEAANPAQQAAIAINMKKHNQKPKTEGAKVDRMQKHIAKSEKDLGHSKKDAEAIGWATLNKRGYLDNANKKEHTEEGIEGNMTVRSMPLMQPLKKRNPVAKNAIQSGAGKHANNLKKAVAQGRKAKHKAQAIPFDESAKPLNFLQWAMEQAEFKGFDKNPAIYESAKQAFAEAKISEIKKGQKDSNGFTKCWPGHHAAGTKKGKNGGQVRNCVPNESQGVAEAGPNAPYTPSPAKPFRNPRGFNKQGTGVGNKLADLNRKEWEEKKKKEQGIDPQVTETAAWQKKSGKNKNGGLNAKGVKSYRCEHPGSKLQTAVTTKPSKLKKGSKAAKRRKSFCARMSGVKGPMKKPNGKPTRKALALRKWNCEGVENLDAMLAEAIEKGTLQPGQYYIWTVYFDDGSKQRIKVTKDNFDPKAYYAKKNKVVINVDYDWTAHND
jgi:hypothetical protein